MDSNKKTGVQIELGDTKVELVRNSYANGRLAIQAYDITNAADDDYGFPWGNISVNLIHAPLSEENAIYLDENNLKPWRVEIIAKLGRFTGRKAESGWCAYPEFVFDDEVFENMRDDSELANALG